MIKNSTVNTHWLIRKGNDTLGVRTIDINLYEFLRKCGNIVPIDTINANNLPRENEAPSFWIAVNLCI